MRAYREAQGDCVPIGGYPNHQIAAYSICYVDPDDRRGRDIACAAARWYLGDNQAELQKLRFGTLVGGQTNQYHEQIKDTVRDRLGMIRSRTNDQLIEDGIVIGGSPDTVCRQIEKYQRAGFDMLLLMLQAGYTTHDQVLRAQELLGTHVIPKFQTSADLAPPVSSQRLAPG